MPIHVDRYHMHWDTVLQQIFMVIKMGKKYEKLFLAKKDTVRNFREHFEIIFVIYFWCSNI